MRKVGVVIIVLMGLFSISLGIMRFDARYLMSWTLFDFVALNIPSVGLFLLGTMLIIYRERLASSLFSDAAFNTSVDGLHIVRLGFIFLGLYLATLAFSSMLVSIIASYEYSKLDDTYIDTPGFWEYFFPTLAGSAFQLACGTFFIVGSMELTRRVWSLKDIEMDDWENVYVCPVCHEPFDPADYRSDASDPKCSRCGTVLDLNGLAESVKEDGDFEYECDECGFIVSESDKMCPECGADIEEVEDEVPTGDPDS